METNTKNIFQQFLIEEFEKKKDKKQVDIVTEKKRKFNILLDKAQNELRNKLYETASKSYYDVILFLKKSPYPDELNLSREKDYCIKCCFSYSTLVSSDRFKDDDITNVLLDTIKELNDGFRTKLFPMFLLVLLNFYRKDWLTTLTWCNEIANCSDEEEENYEPTDDFKELLPESREIRCKVENCEEIAFFGYGEKLLRNMLLEPQLKKFISWTSRLDDFIANKVAELRSPVSDSDLHSLFHQDIFPIWCLANDKDYNSYYSDKFVTNCGQCLRAKLYENISRTNGNMTDDQTKFEKCVAECAAFYKKFACENVSETQNVCAEDLKQPHLSKEKVERITTTSGRIYTCSAASQTERIKTNNKYIQTEGNKGRNTEVQVGDDSQVLNTLLEIKNKYLSMHEKKDDIIVKLQRKINDLQDKAHKDTIGRRTSELESRKKLANLKFEIQELREQLTQSDKKLKAENQRNATLKKLLIEQMCNSHNLHKQHYKELEGQARFMVTYLKDLCVFLTPKSIPDENTCRRSTEMWENQLRSVTNGMEQFNNFYQKARMDVINSDVYNIPWPNILKFPKLEDNIIFLSFKAAIRNIIQTEETLYWKHSADYQTPRLEPLARGPINNFPPNIQRLQFQPQHNSLAGQGLLYQNFVDTPPKDSRPISQQNIKMDQTDEFLNKIGGTEAGSSPTPHRESPTKRSCKTNDKIEKETILLDYVFQRCSGATEEQVTLALLTLLEENKGTLSHLPKDRIVADVKALLRAKKQTVWVTPKSPHVDWHNDHTDSECAICFEEFCLQDKYTLPCQHEYHKKCIKKWLRTSSVCPICRVHSVIDEEFPPLH